MNEDSIEITTRSKQDIFWSLSLMVAITSAIMIIVGYGKFRLEVILVVVIMAITLLLLSIKLFDAMKINNVTADRNGIKMSKNNKVEFDIKWSDISDFRIERHKSAQYFFFTHNGKTDGISSSEIGKKNMNALHGVIKRYLWK